MAPTAQRPPGVAATARSRRRQRLRSRRVAGLVAQVAQVPSAQVLPGSRLETDLGLDSLGRIELLSVIEEELGTFVDDGQLDPDATVAELERLVEAARETRARRGHLRLAAQPDGASGRPRDPGAAAGPRRLRWPTACASVASTTSRASRGR